MTWADLSPPYATIVADPPWPYDDKPTGYQRERSRRAFLPYSMMTVAEIAALPVGDLAAPAAHLFLWTTQRYLWAARDVCREWGWRAHPMVLTWCKAPMGRGGGSPAFCPTTEFILYARRPIGALIRAAREAAGLNQSELFDLVRSGPRTGLLSNWENDLCYPNAADWTRLREVLPALAELPALAAEPLVRQDTTWWQWPRQGGKHSTKPPGALYVIEQVAPEPRVELFARQPRLGWDHWGLGYEGTARELAS